MKIIVKGKKSWGKKYNSIPHLYINSENIYLPNTIINNITYIDIK